MVTNDECSVQETRMPAGMPTASAPSRSLGRALAWARAGAARRRVRARLREDLNRLDARMLRDIGVHREDLLREAYKPWWRP